MADIHSQIHNSPNNTAISALALRQQDADCAGLVAVTPPASCDKSSIINSDIRILRLPEVILRVGLKRASIYLHMAAGIFPKSISLGPRAVGWLEHEIDAWLAKKILERKMINKN
jgi:prophage regulatory protein